MRHARLSLGEGLGGEAKNGGPVGQSEPLHLACEPLEQAAQVPCAVVVHERRRGDAGRPQFADRRRQRAGEPRHAGNRRQALQFAVRRRQPRGAGGDGLGSERRDRAQTAGRQIERGGLERPLVERHRVDAQHATAGP